MISVMSEPIESPAVSSGDCPLLEGGTHNLLASCLQPSEGVQAIATRTASRRAAAATYSTLGRKAFLSS